MIDTGQMDDFPYREGRFSFNKKEFLREILTAIEKWYFSSSTPQNKRIVVTGSGIATHICYGAFKFSARFEDQEQFQKLRMRVIRCLNTFATERVGNNTWRFTVESINELRKEIGSENS